jgi:hypothetical protein
MSRHDPYVKCQGMTLLKRRTMKKNWKEELTEYEDERRLTKKQKAHLESILGMCCDLSEFELNGSHEHGALKMAIEIFESPNPIF